MNSEEAVRRANSTTYAFGEFRLEAENLLLFKDSEVIPLAPKASAVLLTLIKANGRMLTKQEILDAVWADTFVEEANLTHHISALRKALGEDKNGKKFIETIPRRGYRFVAEVKNAVNPDSATEIVLSERTTARAVEETTFETDGSPFKPEIDPAAIDATPKTALLAQKKPRPVVWVLAAVIFLLIGATAFFGYRNFYSSRNQTAPNEISFKRLTPDEDVNASCVSPDGQSVVFVKNENGQRSMWRKQIATGEMTQLTPNVSTKDVGIFSTRFSPDGRWIYYTQLFSDDIEKDVDIYRIPVGGGAEQKILPGLALRTDFSISPNGKQIAYTFDWRQVIVADIETGNKQIIVDWDGVKHWVRCENNSVAWSPDGSRLIFAGGETKNNNINNQLLEINLRTNELKQIPNPEKINVRQIEWLADDSGLVVTRFTKLNGLEIWFVNHYTGEIRRISKENDRLDNLRISADGKTIVASQWLGQFNIWTAPADNIEKRRQITIGAAAMHGTGGLAQMPDGRILYTSTESGTMEIWIMNHDGGERKQLTIHAGNQSYQPHPTKDGRYIVFLSDRSGTNQVWRMGADGKNPVQLSRASESYDYNLSPESDVYYITFLADEQKYQIYKVPVAGGEPVKIDDYYCPSTPPVFSPDGKWILFFGGKTKDENPRVGIIERAGGKVVCYFDNGFEAVDWMPDSKSIVDKFNQGKEVWRQPIDGSPPQKIYDLSPLKTAKWDFSADGKTIVFSLGNSTSEVVMIQNFSENAK